MKSQSLYPKTTLWIFAALFLGLLAGCQASQEPPLQELPPAVIEPPLGMSESEAATLMSLEQIDDFPLYTMQYLADYDQDFVLDTEEESIKLSVPAWSCALFAAMGDPEEMFYGRNFDWEFSPALLLFTNPPEGYASVSMVDIAYLGYGGERAYNLTELPLSELTDLLVSPYLPFDGMNEAGLAIGMASVPPGGVEPNPEKETVGSVLVIRKMLDQAATVEEAIIILKSYNIDFVDGPPVHYLIADKSGSSGLVEFSGGEVKEIPNSGPWQGATNFLMSEATAGPESRCWRYARISEEMEKKDGSLTDWESLRLLKNIAQDNTQWSVVYGISTGEIMVVMGRVYGDVHRFRLGGFE